MPYHDLTRQQSDAREAGLACALAVDDRSFQLGGHLRLSLITDRYTNDAKSNPRSKFHERFVSNAGRQKTYVLKLWPRISHLPLPWRRRVLPNLQHTCLARRK